MKRTAFFLIAFYVSITAVESAPYYTHPVPAIPAGVDADSSHNWDAIHYEVQLQITPVAVPNSIFIEGETDIQFTPEITGLDTVDLHFNGLDIASVQLDGVTCDFNRVDDMLYVALPEPHNPGEDLHLSIAYSGNPEITFQQVTQVGIFHPSDNLIYTHADPFGARNWMPCWDEPWDKATIRQRLTFPSDFVVVANGTFEDSTAMEDWIEWTYYMNQPMTTYLISFCASNYVTFEQTAGSVAIKHYVYPSHLSAAQYDFGRVPEMIEAFSGYFGPYPFDTYGYAEASVFGGSGAMENQTIVTFGYQLITGNRTYEIIVAHELAHQWFGDAVSYIDWPEMWLSEGFATYSEALWREHLDGMSAYLQYMVQTQITYYGWENTSNPLPIYDPPWNIIWTPLTYEKPASVLHMLRYHLGTEDFFDVLRSYVSQYQYENASTGDFAEVVQQVSGEDYGWFFDQWIYQPGYPIFEYFATWEPDGDDYLISLSVAQVQNDNMPRFRTDADLYVFSDGDTTIQRVTIEALESQEIEIAVTDEPDSVQLDPQSWILGYKYRRDDLTEPILEATDITIEDEGGDGFLDPGESGDLSFILANSGLPTDSLVVEITSMDAQLTVIEGTRNAPALPFNGQYDFGDDPFVVENAPFTGPRWVEFRVDVNEAVSGDSVATLWIYAPVGTPELLLVDDDGGGIAEIGHQEALDNIRRVYRTVEYSSASDLPPLEDYLAVIWACGEETVNTLTNEDQTLLLDYLENSGGSLLLSGRGIVPDLEETDFFQNVLHAQAIATTPIVVLYGVDPLVENMSFFIFGDGSNQDVIEADDDPDAGLLLTYAGGQGAAVKYDGTYKTCVLGFGFEDVQSGNPIFDQPEDLLDPLITWMTGTTGVERDEKVEIPTLYRLGQNYPNPFNAETVIPLELPRRSAVKIELYNLQGQHIGSIYDGIKDAGFAKIRFDASGLSSGVYFYRVTAEGLEGGEKFTELGKALLLK